MPRGYKDFMTVRKFTIIDDFLDNPHEHVDDIFKNDFYNVESEVGTFKGIQPRENDIVYDKVIEMLGDRYDINTNFVRLSPEHQDEPNFIHSDEIMGDVTVLLYLSKDHPKNDGTTMYNDDETEMINIRSKFNRLLIFEANTLHSRNIFSNFGSGKSSRLIQVLFLSEKKWQQ